MRTAKIAGKARSPLMWMVSVAGVVSVATGSVWQMRARVMSSAAPRAYVAEGYGGFVSRSAQEPALSAEKDPLQSLRAAYRAGHYAQVEAEAEPLVAQGQSARQVSLQRQAAEAELIAAYAAARQGHITAAEERFAQTRTLAADLPDHGAPPRTWGEPEPTLEEEAAFQQIVCVGAEGKQPQAEAGYRYFLQRYPQSLLIHAAVKRIARYHGGDVPKNAETLWFAAMQQQAQARKAEQRAHSLCGPECLAELLKREGKPANVETLATEMRTDENGTSLANLAQSARRHGFHAQGLQLTPKGLQRQKLPLVALVESGHFVLVEQVQPDHVQVWDPDANGVGKSAHREFSPAQWQQTWSGYALALR